MPDADRARRAGSPSWRREALLLQRVFLAEKWLVARLHYGHVDPREAGVGNIVNCGAAMYMAPVGIANAGDPTGAYAEAIDVAGAHQSSYGREAAGVFAAAVAAAMAPGRDRRRRRGRRRWRWPRTAPGRRSRRWPRRRDGADRLASRRFPRCATAVEPFDTVGPDYREPALDARRPSRTKAIEELPVALGFVLVAGGDVRGGGARRRRTTAATPTRSRRWPARSPARSAALGAVPADWRDGGRRGEPDSTWRAGRRDHGRRWPREIFAPTGRRARRRPRGARGRLGTRPWA